MEKYSFPKDFLFGSATASTQIEGGDVNCNWYHWSNQGKIKDNESCFTACDHYNRVEEDVQLLADAKHEIYRFSIEWSRIQPEKNKWSQEGINHYIDELKLLKAKGIKPLITFHHFTHPQWLEEQCQWLNPETIDLFVNFVEKLVTAFGDLCNEYCTINEPNVFAMSSYIEGQFPPGGKSQIPAYLKASKHMIIAHKRCYESIHRIRKSLGFNDTSVGFAMHFTYLEPQSGSKRANICYKIMNYLFHTIFMKGFVDGILPLPLGFGGKSNKKYCDHIGINYYTRHIIKPSNNPAMFFGEYVINPDATSDMLTDMGWEIYPEGLYHIVKKAYTDYKLPIYITENGLADAKDEKRVNYIYEHLKVLSKLIQQGVDVKRYYYWSTMDNFEWAEGYWPRFGLYEVNYNTQERTLRKSGKFYAEICAKKAITDEMIKEYL